MSRDSRSKKPFFRVPYKMKIVHDHFSDSHSNLTFFSMMNNGPKKEKNDDFGDEKKRKDEVRVEFLALAWLLVNSP